MSEPSICVTSHPGGELVFDVIVRDATEARRWTKLGAAPSRCVEAVMRFSWIAESKESILNAFDMNVVRRYFPRFDDAFPSYLARLGGEPGHRE
jgi:hypothetical protein